MAEIQQLPSKFISVHALSAAKGFKYTCVICNSEGSFLCTQCRSCYCCREHLLLDDLACHSFICDRQAAIREILKLPLATRIRPEITSKLALLQDECRRIAYLESRRHVLEGNNELALPAAERSLKFARDVHGDQSIELVPPLLALADVACLAGAQDAARGYASRARWLLLGREGDVRARVEAMLRPYLRRCLGEVDRLSAQGPSGPLSPAAPLAGAGAVGGAGGAAGQTRASPISLTKRFGLGFSNSSPVPHTLARMQSPATVAAAAAVLAPTPPPSHPRRRKVPETFAQDRRIENSITDEMYRSEEGLHLASMTCRYWSTETRLRAAEGEYPEALNASAITTYFAALAHGPASVQLCLQLYTLSKLLVLARSSPEQSAVHTMVQAQRMLKKTIVSFYTPYILGVQAYMRTREATSAGVGRDRLVLARLLQEFLKADRKRDEEERLSFRADIKESAQYVLFSVDYLERGRGERSPEFVECVLCLALCLEIIEDPNRSEYVSKAWELLGAVDEQAADPVLVALFRYVFQQ